VLETVVVIAAVAAGVTGAWSPCGFSMVDTLAPHGYAGRLATTLAACVTFAAGALAGGAATFGGLAVLGHALASGPPAPTATAVAALITLAAAVGEARGARIVPQVRRQVPESWRRVLPVTLAAGLYGILLGLGFTTFILTFAVWALAGVSVALGDPHLGLAIGLGFGLGRLLPVVVLAPAASNEWGSDAHAAMAERPAILRGLRAVDAAALGLCALALATAPAQAATPKLFLRDATDPSVDGPRVAWHTRGGAGFVAQGGAVTRLPGVRPAVGGSWTARLQAGSVVAWGPIRPSGVVFAAAGADAVAVDAGWVAWHAREGGIDVLRTARLPSGVAGPVVAAAPGRTLGRPALDGDVAVYHQTTARGAVIRVLNLVTGAQQTLRSQKRTMLLNPSVLGGELLYVSSTYKRQRLKLGALAPRSTSRDRTLWSTFPTARRDTGADKGHGNAPGHTPPKYPRPPRGRKDTLWTTALAPTAAYVTRLRKLSGKPLSASVLRVAR
jgi:hypothetical protein